MLVERLKQNFALIFFYTLDIRNINFNPKFYQHFLPSLVIVLNLKFGAMSISFVREFNIREFSQRVQNQPSLNAIA